MMVTYLLIEATADLEELLEVGGFLREAITSLPPGGTGSTG